MLASEVCTNLQYKILLCHDVVQEFCHGFLVDRISPLIPARNVESVVRLWFMR